MPGMIGSGLGYKRSAMAGLERVSEQEQQRQTANRQIAEQETQQAIGMGVSAASLIATIVGMAMSA